MKGSFIRIGSSLAVTVISIKFLQLALTSQKGFLAANSKYLFMNIFPISNSVIIMLILSGLGVIYLWYLDVNK